MILDRHIILPFMLVGLGVFILAEAFLSPGGIRTLYSS
jgi:cadmium resistance protein CadD (predicted permease)